MELHRIQRHILKKLSQHKSVRYADLKPARIEGNQFTYHLKTLITKGLVSKREHTYTLTTKGLHHATQVNFEHFFVRAQPKIVTLVVCTNTHGEYLLYTRSKQPFLGKVGFPYGKIHLGEHVSDAAARELQEKTGYTATLSQKGIMYLLVTDTTGEVVTHMLCHIFAGHTPVGTPHTPAPFGTIHWASKEKLLTQPLMPGVLDALTIAEHPTDTLLFEELSFEVHE